MRINQPTFTVVLPWRFKRVARRAQRRARQGQAQVRGRQAGLEITASGDVLVALGLARESDQHSLPLVGQLRQVGVQVRGSRTLHLPEGQVAVEIATNLVPEQAARVAGWLVGSGRAPHVATVYDRAGRGHTRAQVGAPRWAGGTQVRRRPVEPVRRGVTAATRAALVQALRDAWEQQAEGMVQSIDWDSGHDEAPTLREIMGDNIAAYLPDNLVLEWESLEAETQSALLRQAFPDELNQVPRYDYTTRGATREEQPKTLQAWRDPLDEPVPAHYQTEQRLPGGTRVRDFVA